MGQIFHHVALVAQGIEHRIPNPGVACSIHAGGTIFSQVRRGVFCLDPSLLYEEQQIKRKRWKEYIV